MNDVLSAIHGRLAERGETVATVESLTGGLLAAELTMTAGASATYRGGLVVYATDLKATLAGVDAAMLARCGPVSDWTARELASQGRLRLGSSWALATTGVAGPDTQDGVAVGTVFLAVASASDVQTTQLALTGDRNTIRRSSVVEAVLLLAHVIGLDLA